MLFCFLWWQCCGWGPTGLSRASLPMCPTSRQSNLQGSAGGGCGREKYSLLECVYLTWRHQLLNFLKQKFWHIGDNLWEKKNAGEIAQRKTFRTMSIGKYSHTCIHGVQNEHTLYVFSVYKFSNPVLRQLATLPGLQVFWNTVTKSCKQKLLTVKKNKNQFLCFVAYVHANLT